MSQDKYPSVRDALFSDDTVANLYCAAKYIVWQLMYVLLALIAGVVLVFSKLWAGLKFIAPTGLLARASGGALERVLDGLEAADAWVERHSLVKKTLLALATAIFTGVVVVGAIAIGVFLWLLVTENTAFVGLTLLMVGAIVALTFLYEYITSETNVNQTLGSGIDSAKSKAANTPGVRRAYGECPVSFKMEPRWVQKLFGEE